ncbi:hypothetical protein DIPPA_22547 [Diplonema papillatum]|nr:hypothetical protein DIPPA_22547 [Diplonema papillatum]
MPSQATEKALAVSGGCLASYLVFYSAYDKSTKSLNFSLLTKIFSFRDFDYSMKQINKVTGLGSLTLAGLALFPSKLSEGCQGDLLKIAMMIGATHAVKSSYLYYGFNPRKMLAGQGKRVAFEVPALILGLLGFGLMATDAFPKARDLNPCAPAALAPAAYAGLLFSLLHFYFIETPTGLPQDLPCRPYAYTAVATGALALRSFGFVNLAKYLSTSVGIPAA